MTNRYLLSLCTLLVIAFWQYPAQAAELAVGRFSQNGLTGWEVKEFKGRTQYTLVQDQGKTVVKAVAHGTASGLVKKLTFDPRTYRYLSWSWNIPATVVGGDERTKQGDDYAARVYVVFPGRFFWQMRAINYIWASRLPKGHSIPNAFTGNAILIAVESGSNRTGQWITEQRDILADYRQVFGEEPPNAGAIAIMTDADNTGRTATAWYGDITISSTR